MIIMINMEFEFLLILLTLFCVSGTQTSECGALGAFFLRVESRRNSTGHRRVIAKVDIPADSRKFWRNPKDMTLEVTQRVRLQDEDSSTLLEASFEADETQMPSPGYELVRGLGWYRHHLQPLTWEEARLACEAEGAHLAVLNSKEEAAALKGIFSKAPKSISNATYANLAFIGFSDMVDEGKYITIFGETISEAGYAEWSSGQPNNLSTSTDPDQDCGAVYRETGKLGDVECRGKLSYFCEHSIEN